jgi:cytochrome c biogenesis protein CcmG/thiol:disulfide interchange protein DsbE
MKTILSTAFLLVFVCVAMSQQTSEKKLYADNFIGKKAPEFHVEKWIGPQPETKGKFILIDFWATWCGPCRKAIPELNNFHNKFKDKLVVIGISSESEETVLKMTTPVIEYYSAFDTKRKMEKELKVVGIPHCILIDPDGIVRWQGFPLMEGYELTEKVIQEILDAYQK